MRDEARAYRIVAERIRDLIRDDRLQPGARLPSERDLAARLELSRASVREALIALDLAGEVEVHGGSGVYVSGAVAKPAARTSPSPGPFELLAVRRLIEPEVAAIAARVATDGAIDALFSAASVQEDGKSGREELGRGFHRALARATGNGALVGVVDYLWEQHGAAALLERQLSADHVRATTVGEQRRIVQAVAAHDPAAASRAMSEHLERLHRTLMLG